MFKSNLRHKEYLTVHQTIDKPPSEIKAFHTQEIKKCCCCGQGVANVTAHIQKDSYMAGEVLDTACLLHLSAARIFEKTLLFQAKRP